MADIPVNRDVVFPAWKTIVENIQTRVATVFTPTVGRVSVISDEIEGVPNNFGDDLMSVIRVDIPNDIWSNHDVVNFEGNEYPEEFNANVPAGKTLNANLGARPIEYHANASGQRVFNTERPDDVAFVNIAAGGTVNLSADKIQNKEFATGLVNPSTGNTEQYPIGGRNVLVVNYIPTGTGDITADMGKYGNNAFVSARNANVKLGNGEGYYQASHTSQGHHVEAGPKADNFVYDFDGVGAGSIGSNTFDAKLGSTGGVEGVDAIQLVNLPAGYVVNVQVSAIRGGGTFKDSDLKATIKDSTGRVVGDVSGKNVNYLFLSNENGHLTPVSPAEIGVGGSRNYSIGSQAAAMAASSEKESESSIRAAASSPTELPIPQRVEIEAPIKK